MKRIHFVCLFLCLSTFLLSQSNPVPFVNQPLVPGSVAAGGQGFTLVVNGTGFVSGSVVKWNGTPLATSYIGASQLNAAIPASDIATYGTASVKVTSPGPGGGASNVLFFEITNPAPPLVSNTATFGTDTQPAWIALADLNSDGKPDLVTANVFDTVSVILSNGDGTFQNPKDYPTGPQGQNPDCVALADVNRDGNLDLVVLNAGSRQISVLLGNGDGTFQSATQFPTGSASAPQSLVLGDFNEDGNLDVAVTDLSDGTVSILLGNGDGSFQSPLKSSAGTPHYIVAGDFNHDGKLDLVVTDDNNNYNTISVLLGNGDGTFQAPATYPAGPASTYRLVTADFNGDGVLDLAVDNYDSGVSILLGNGDGTFQSPVSYPVGSGHSTQLWSMASGDLDGDGTIDLAFVDATDGESGPVEVLFGNGDGTFQPQVGLYQNIAYGPIIAGDFNNDGRADLAVASRNGSGGTVLLQVPVVTLSPTGLSFGSVNVGSTSTPQSVVLTNAGSAPLEVSSIAVAGTDPGDFSQNNNCGSGVIASATCTITVTFSPTVPGLRSASLSFSDNAPGTPQNVPLSGTGNLISSATAIASSSNPSAFGQSITLTATVTSQGSGAPSGTVTFTYGSTTLCNAASLVVGVATCAYSTLPAGSDMVTASYSGDSKFSGSSASLNQKVSEASTTLMLTSSLNPSGLDQPVTFTATIMPQYGGQATGSATFRDGATTLGSAAVSGNVASLATSGLAIGTHSITAVYGGDSNFLGSTSNTVSQVVTKATTTTTLASSVNPSLQGKPVTFTAVVSSLAGTPTGKVQFLNGKTVLTTKKLTSGSAKYTTSKLPPGANIITAVYEGDSNSNGSTSAPVNQFVMTATTTTLTSAPNPSKYGQAVTFTAAVTSGAGAPPDGETVSFMKGKAILGTGTLAGGTTKFSTSTLKVDTTTVKAVYGGDSNFTSSTSNAVKQVVEKLSE